MSPSLIISTLSIGFRGIYGSILDVSADDVFLFVFFGSLLQITGATLIELLKRAPLFITPMAVLIYLLMKGLPLMVVASCSIISAIIVSLFRRKTIPSTCGLSYEGDGKEHVMSCFDYVVGIYTAIGMSDIYQ